MQSAHYRMLYTNILHKNNDLSVPLQLLHVGLLIVNVKPNSIFDVPLDQRTHGHCLLIPKFTEKYVLRDKHYEISRKLNQVLQANGDEL